MKQKQQVISRFFAPKAASEPSSKPFLASRLSPSTAVQWPPARTSASLRNLQRGSSQSSTRKSLEEAFPGHRKRPSSPDSPGFFAGGGEENDPEPVDLDRPEICSGAISLGGERDQKYVPQNAGTSESNEPRSATVISTYKRRRKKGSTAEEYPKLGFLDEEDPLSTLTENESQKPNTGEPTSVSTYWKSKESFEIPASDPARHKKFVEKLLTSTDPEGPLQASKPSKVSSKEQYTPLEQQVVELKAKYKDVLLMVEVGYRYRMFGEDAETAARVLGIFAYNDHNFMTASVPSFRLHVHVRRLVEAGYKVGVVHQTETAAIKAHGGNKVGPFTRGLSALYSRATLEAAADLGGGEPSTERGSSSNYLMCIAEQVNTLKSSAKGSVSKQGASDKGEADTKAMLKGAYDTTIGVIAVETATGDVMYGQFKDSVMRTELEAHLLTCSPAELLLASPLASSTEKLLLDFAGPSSNVRIERVPCDTLENGAAIAEVLGFYGSNESTDFNHERCEMEEKFDEGLEAIMAMPELVIQALALALRHLKQFGLERVLRLGATFRPFARVSEMSLSSNTLQQLEILQNNADGTTKGSLLWLMDHTYTAFGARLFQHWLTHPLRDQALISARLDAVSEIADSMGSVGGSQSEGSFPGSGRGGGFIGASSRGCTAGLTKGSWGSLGAVLMALKKIPDVERGITRIFHGTATASEFVAVIQALLTAVKQLQQIHLEDEDETEMLEPHVEKWRTFSSPLLKRLFAAASSSVVSEHALRLLSFLNKEAASTGDKHNLFICGTGKFPMVEKCKAAVKAAEQCLDSLLPQYRKLLKTPNLQYMSVSGNTHLIEVPVAQHVPCDWVKICSTKKTNRYHSPEVLQALDVLTLAKEELTVECNKAWDSFLVAFASYYVDFRAMVHALATLDCLYSLAIVSRNQGYTRPNFVQESSVQLIIEGGRHPVLEATLQEGFVPNDTCLHADHEHCQIITGPNMGGKSCYIRQVALIAIMAQVGSYVPAVSAKLHAFDAIYTRMGASDSFQRGSSTFLEELGEASIILRRATPYSLVIMDELGRGTSTHDGVAIAYATLEYLLKDIRCLTLFVTHYPKLAELRERFPGEIGAYHVSYLAEASSDPLVVSEVACKQSPDNDDCDSAVLKECHGQNVASEAAHKITFLYKLVQGVASRSFGLHVARLAQIPEACILKASTMAAKLENEVRSRACPLKRNGVSEKPHVAGKDELQGAYTSVRNNSCNELQATKDHAEENNDLSLTNNVHDLKGKECLEGSEGLVNGMSVAEVSELLSSVFSALKSPEEACSALKMLQERTALSFRV